MKNKVENEEKNTNIKFIEGYKKFNILDNYIKYVLDNISQTEVELEKSKKELELAKLELKRKKANFRKNLFIWYFLKLEHTSLKFLKRDLKITNKD